MKRTWKLIAGVALVLGTTGTCLAAGGNQRGGKSAGGFKPTFTGGNQVAKVQNLQPRVQNLQPKLGNGLNGQSLGGNAGNSQVFNGKGISTMPLKPNFPLNPIVSSAGNGNKSNKPLNIPGIYGQGGTTTLKSGIVNKIPLNPKFPGPITTLPCPVKPICPIKPICPPFNPPYCPGPILGNPNCNPWWDGWCYNPCTPIIIPIGGCYGSGFGGGYTSVVTETIVVEVPAQPVVVVNEVAPAATAEPVNKGKLTQVPVGATLTLQGKELGDKPGQVLLQFEKFSFPAQVSEWKPDHVTTTLPQMGLAGPTKAQIFVLKENGEVATTLAVELVPAVAK